MKQEHKEETLLGQHALKRLDKVQEKNRRAYDKKKDKFHFGRIFMGLILALILFIMFLGMRH